MQTPRAFRGEFFVPQQFFHDREKIVLFFARCALLEMIVKTWYTLFMVSSIRMRYSSSVSTMKRKAEKQPSIRFRQSLFWDVDPKTIDPKKHASYIIERILDFGFDPEVRWLTRFYSKKKIKDVLRRSRVLHKKTKSLWEKIL